MKTSKQQIKTYQKFLNFLSNGLALFTCPKCKSEYNPPKIENVGDYHTQINCPYCREFIILDNYKKK